MKKINLISLFLLTGFSLILQSSCTVKKQSELNEFAMNVFNALRENDTTKLFSEYTVNAKNVWDYKKLLDSIHSPTHLELNPELSDEMLNDAKRKVLKVFRRSYNDLLQYEATNYAVRIDDDSTTSLIIWVKTKSSYEGILIHALISTKEGYKVMDWNGPISDPNRGFESLVTKKAILKSDNEAGCTYPKDNIAFEYKFSSKSNYR